MKNCEKRVLFMVSSKNDYIKDATVRNSKNEKMFTVSWDFIKNKSTIKISNINNDRVKSIDEITVKKVDVDSNLLRLKDSDKDLHLKITTVKSSYKISFPIDFKDYRECKDMYIIIINYTILPLTMGKAS